MESQTDTLAKQATTITEDDIKDIENKKASIDDDEKIRKFATLLKAITALKISKDDKKPSEVVPNLFIGSIGAAMNKKLLEELGITHVLMTAANLNPPFKDDFTYKTIPILDTPKANVMIHFETANEFIHSSIEGGGKVLVHCFAGKSRSATFVLAYLMEKQQMPLADAFELLKEKRGLIEPNIGFIVQLKAYEKSLFGKCSKFDWVPERYRKKEGEGDAENSKDGKQD